MKKMALLFAIVATGALGDNYLSPSLHFIVDSLQLSNMDKDTFGDNEERGDDRSSPTFTYFTGTATNVTVGNTVNSYFYFSGQHVYFRFHSLSREYLSLNYSGPTANLTIYYSNFFLSSDYLTSITDVGSAIDCYYFDEDAEYILDFSSASYVSFTQFSFSLQILDMNMSQKEKYVLHQTMDSSSNVGFHYKTEFYNVDTSSSIATPASIVNHAPGGETYLNLIDSQTYFYKNPPYTFTDNRRLISDTGYDEYSSVAYCSTHAFYNSHSLGYYSNYYYRGTGTFISPTAVVSCAHLAYSHDSIPKPNVVDEYLPITGLNSNINFQPGYNSYTNESHYGRYDVTDLYASVSYILAYNVYDTYSPSCAEFDWCVYLTSNTIVGSRIHSYMGVSHFSYSESLDYWPHARNAGYPKIGKCPTGTETAYSKAMWASYPLQNSVVLNGNRIDSDTITISGGNSGGPLYYKASTIYNGQLLINSNLLGICSGDTKTKNSNQEIYKLTAHFCSMTHLLVNMIKTLASIS